MFLIDTSVWIAYFRGETNPAVKYFDKILENGRIFGITSIIYQEILQGAASKQDFEKLDNYLESQYFYYPEDVKKSYQLAAEHYFKCRKNYQLAAEHYFKCRKKGLTIRSTIDCLIAQIAIENDLMLLHNDRDFVSMASIITDLKLVEL
ncbi:MAG: PilT protein domain protein [Gammaproteobacteria bacterium]|nr:PilT protein domain protein [Gammaproteobacteria bacterium]